MTQSTRSDAASPRRTTARKTGAGSRRRAPARDAIALLKQDHADVKKMYRRFEKLVDEAADASERGALAAQICQALTVHATVEEELFYPAARDALTGQDLLDHADVEHETAKSLIAQIEAMDPDQSHFDAKVSVLCEYVLHHVKEEEGELFPACRRSRKMALKPLGESIAARKQALMQAPEPATDRAPARSRRSEAPADTPLAPRC